MHDSYQLITFYVPESDVEQVKNALFSAGAGKLGEYEEACWQTLGKGQFKPLPAANPTIGEKNEVSYVSEYKVEMLCNSTLIEKAIEALKLAHPYEEPAYFICK